MIYFDNSATTRPYKEVVDFIAELSLEEFGNPSSLHRLGIRAEKIMEEARKTLADTIRAGSGEILFTSGGTEAINIALRGAADALKRTGKHIITSPTEHAAALETLKALESDGFEVEMLDVDEFGKMDIEDLKKKIKPQTILVNIMMVNNETGTIQPVEEASRVIKAGNKNTLFHVDAVQAFGKIPIDTRVLKADLISFSAHKIHGPKGVGMLYIRTGSRINPILTGGGQEKRLRSGTENVPGIAGFAKAASIKNKNMASDNRRIKEVREKLISELLHVTGGSIRINSPENGLPGILNVSFRSMKSEIILHSLETHDIFVSSGSACHSKKGSLSHVIKAMNIPKEWADGSVRFSFSGENTAEEAVLCVKTLENIMVKTVK